jgi:hypothetical protein
MTAYTPWTMPITFYNEWLKLTMQTINMLNASAEVIGYRTTMMQQAMQGKVLWTHPEFSRLWQEKIAANMEASASLTQSMWKQATTQHHTTPEKQMVEGMKALNHATRSYEKKATANAKRLRAKK